MKKDNMKIVKVENPNMLTLIIYSKKSSVKKRLQLIDNLKEGLKKEIWKRKR